MLIQFLRNITFYAEIPGNDRHVYHYPEERITDDDYGTESYDEENSPHDNEVEKSNRVPDRANKWYANDGKASVIENKGSMVDTTLGVTMVVSLFLTWLSIQPCLSRM